MGFNFNFLEDPSYLFLKNKVNSSTFEKSFLNDKYSDIESWKADTRQFFKEKLSYSPETVPFNEEIVEEEDFGEYTRLKLYFQSAPDCTIPAYLLIPKGLEKPAPAVVMLHDHGAMFYWGKEKMVEHKVIHPVLNEFTRKCYDGKYPASELARRGYVVLVTDCLFFGERRYKLENERRFKKELDKFEYESVEYINKYNSIENQIVEAEVVKGFYYAGWTFAGVRMWDDMASVSYLCSRPEVDSSRIGCVGLSMGGHRAGWLAAMDDRIKCSVVVCWMARYKEMIEQRITNIAWMWAVPGIYDDLDYPDIVSLAAPKPLMVQHGKKDDLFPNETGQQAIETIRKVYAKAGFENRFVSEIYDGPHEFSEEMQKSAFSWMDVNLTHKLI